MRLAFVSLQPACGQRRGSACYVRAYVAEETAAATIWQD